MCLLYALFFLNDDEEMDEEEEEIDEEINLENDEMADVIILTLLLSLDSVLISDSTGTRSRRVLINVTKGRT